MSGRRGAEADGLRIEAGGFGPESRARAAGRMLCQTALLGLSILMTMRCIVTVLDLETEGMLYFGLLLFAAVWSAMYLLRGAARVLLLACYVAGVSTFVLTRLEEVSYGFIYMENAFIALANEYYKSGLSTYVTQYEEAHAVTLFLLAAAQLFLAVYAQAVFCGTPRWPALLLMGLAAFFSLALGTIPQETALAGMLLCIIAVLALRRDRAAGVREAPDGSVGGFAGNAVMAAVLFGVLCLVTSLVIGDEFYRSRIRQPERKASLQSAFEKIGKSKVWDGLTARLESVGGGGRKKGDSIGGLNSGRFSRAGRIEFQNQTALKVTMPYLTQSVYLKGYNGAVYTPEGWEQLDRRALRRYQALAGEYEYDITGQELSGAMLRLLCGGELRLLRDIELYDVIIRGREVGFQLWHGTMTVDYITASDRYIYGPYSYLPEEQDGIQYEGDSYIAPLESRDSYEFEFYMGGNGVWEKFDARDASDDTMLPRREWNPDWDGSNDRYMEFEHAYREFVYDVYTRLPAGHEQLWDLELGADEDDTVWERVNAVIRFLSKYEYTLAPGKMPEEADFVDYFLFENKKGYCVHFASSAVLLLRWLGVPARYAEGYLITESDIKHAVQVGRTELHCCGNRPSWGDFQRAEGGYSLLFSGSVPLKMVEVRDYSAHAWVEVYLNGIGWVPVEVTAGFLGESVKRLPEELLAEAAKPDPTPLPTNTPIPARPTKAPVPPVTATPSVTKAPSATAAPSPTAIPAGPSGGTPGADGPGNGVSPARWWRGLPAAARAALSVCGVICLAAAALLLRYRATLRYRNRKCSNRRRALELYARMERLVCLEARGDEPRISRREDEGYEAFAARVLAESTIAGESFRACQELALRAAFGGTHITSEELELLAQSASEMQERLFGSSGALRKFYLKFLKIC